MEEPIPEYLVPRSVTLLVFCYCGIVGDLAWKGWLLWVAERNPEVGKVNQVSAVKKNPSHSNFL